MLEIFEWKEKKGDRQAKWEKKRIHAHGVVRILGGKQSRVRARFIYISSDSNKRDLEMKSFVWNVNVFFFTYLQWITAIKEGKKNPEI